MFDEDTLRRLHQKLAQAPRARTPDEIIASLKEELASQTGEELALRLSRSDLMQIVSLVGSDDDRIARAHQERVMDSELTRFGRARWNFERGDGSKDAGVRAKRAVKELGWIQERSGPRQKTPPIELLRTYVMLTTEPGPVLIFDHFRKAAGIDDGMTTIEGTPLKPWAAIDVLCRLRGYQSPKSCRNAVARAITQAKKWLEEASDAYPLWIAELRDLIERCILPRT